MCSEVYPRGIPKPLHIADDFFHLRRKLAAPNSPPKVFVAEDGEKKSSSAKDDGHTAAAERDRSKEHSIWRTVIEMYTDRKSVV